VIVPFDCDERVGLWSPPGTPTGAPETIGLLPPLRSRALQQEWARLVKQLDEADPLLCSQCGGSIWCVVAAEVPRED